MKKSIAVSIDAEKLTALEMYLGQKNLKLSEELEKYSEQLYQKHCQEAHFACFRQRNDYESDHR